MILGEGWLGGWEGGDILGFVGRFGLEIQWMAVKEGRELCTRSYGYKNKLYICSNGLSQDRRWTMARSHIPSGFGCPHSAISVTDSFNIRGLQPFRIVFSNALSNLIKLVQKSRYKSARPLDIFPLSSLLSRNLIH